MMGEGPTYQKRQKERVECRECGKEMTAGSLASHRMTQHVHAKVELGSLGNRKQPANVLAGLHDQGRAKELPCGRLPRMGWDTYSDADAFLQPACPGHCDHLVGRKPPTPKVLTMRHAGPVAGTQQ